MKVIAITKPGCPKCSQAREILESFNIQWVDCYSILGEELVKAFEIEYAPFFIVMDIDDPSYTITTNSALEVKKILGGI